VASALALFGVAWGLAAALCLSAYFLLSEEKGTDAPIHPLLLTTAGTGIGAGVLLAASAAGILPWPLLEVSRSWRSTPSAGGCRCCC
jgi:drug/metabolite transporter (DMT)-like permease